MKNPIPDINGLSLAIYENITIQTNKVYSKNFRVVYHLKKINLIHSINRNKQEKIHMLISINVTNAFDEI